MRPSHLLVLGAGFAALTAARELRRRAPTAKISLLAPRAEFIYLPSLIWVPSRLRRGDDLRIPLSGFLERHRIEFVEGRVCGLAEGGRRVMTDRGEIANDGLIIATGGRFIKKLPGIDHALTLCEGIPAAQAIADRLDRMSGGHIAFGFGSNPQEPSAMRGGPMFELLFGIDTLLRRQKRRERFHLKFFNAATEPGKRLGPKAVGHLLAEMERRSIATHLGSRPQQFSDRAVTTEREEIPADLILFMPGLTGPDWAATAGIPLSPGGFFPADAHCAVQGLANTYVAGDAGSYPGPDWLPKQAHMADLQAKAAAENLLRTLAGQPPVAQPKAELLCIVDTLAAGMLVYRSPTRSFMLPQSRLLHWAKRYFEGIYLKRLLD